MRLWNVFLLLLLLLLLADGDGQNRRHDGSLVTDEDEFNGVSRDQLLTSLIETNELTYKTSSFSTVSPAVFLSIHMLSTDTIHFAQQADRPVPDADSLVGNSQSHLVNLWPNKPARTMCICSVKRIIVCRARSRGHSEASFRRSVWHCIYCSQCSNVLYETRVSNQTNNPSRFNSDNIQYRLTENKTPRLYKLSKLLVIWRHLSDYLTQNCLIGQTTADPYVTDFIHATFHLLVNNSTSVNKIDWLSKA